MVEGIDVRFGHQRSSTFSGRPVSMIEASGARPETTRQPLH